jgi:hypothetical protein
MSTVQPGSEPPADTLGPTVLRMLLGNQLHRFREAAGVTPDRAGYEIRASRSKISRMENGRVGVKERDVADLLTRYDITDEEMRAGIVPLVRQANAPGWWPKYGDVLADWFEAYLGLEAARITSAPRPSPPPAPPASSPRSPGRPMPDAVARSSHWIAANHTTHKDSP